MPKISEAKRLERKKMILNGAFELFAKNGYFSTSIDDIANSVGVSKGLIYTYFKSKEELFLALANEKNNIIEEIKTIIENMQLAEYSKTSDKLLIVWDHLMDQWTKETLSFDRIQFEFWLESSKNSELRQVMLERSNISLNIIKDIIKTGNRTKKTATIQAFARIWWAQIDGLSAYYISHGKVPDAKEISEMREVIKHMCHLFD